MTTATSPSSNLRVAFRTLRHGISLTTGVSAICVSALLTATACSSKSTALPSTTRVTAAPEAIARERLCTLYTAWISAEYRPNRPSDGSTGGSGEEETNFPERQERTRVDSLERFRSALAEDKELPADVMEALVTLKGLRTDVVTDPTKPERGPLIKRVATNLDAKCDTVNGVDKNRATSTTLPLPAVTLTLPPSSTAVSTPPTTVK